MRERDSWQLRAETRLRSMALPHDLAHDLLLPGILVVTVNAQTAVSAFDMCHISSNQLRSCAACVSQAQQYCSDSSSTTIDQPIDLPYWCCNNWGAYALAPYNVLSCCGANISLDGLADCCYANVTATRWTTATLSRDCSVLQTNNWCIRRLQQNHISGPVHTHSLDPCNGQGVFFWICKAAAAVGHRLTD